MGKKTGPKQNTAGHTKPSQFRLGAEVLADLDLIALTLTTETGIPHTRTDAVRLAAKREADRIRIKRGKA